MIIVGAGKITVYLAEQLLSMGVHVKIIEQKREKCLDIKNKLYKATVICGDGTKPDVLMEEGLAEADAVVALTGMDESNIIIAIYAKTASDALVIAKVNEMHFDAVLEQSGIDTTVQPSGITAQRIVHYVRAMANSKSSTMETLYLLNDGSVEAIQFKVKGDGELTGRSIKDLPIRSGVQISAILRGGKCLIPGGHGAAFGEGVHSGVDHGLFFRGLQNTGAETVQIGFGLGFRFGHQRRCPAFCLTQRNQRVIGTTGTGQCHRCARQQTQNQKQGKKEFFHKCS